MSHAKQIDHVVPSITACSALRPIHAGRPPCCITHAAPDTLPPLCHLCRPQEQGSYAVREGPSQGGPSRWPAGDSRATGEQLHFPSDQELGELEAAKQEMTRRLKAELSELEAQCLQDRVGAKGRWGSVLYMQGDGCAR